MLKIIPYLIKEDRGCITSRRRNVIRVGETAPDECAFESLSELGKHITKRKVKLIEELQVVVDGEVDEAATEEAIQANYADHYAHLEAIAIDWIVGMTLTRNQPEPVRHNGKIYDVEQGHTVVDPNHTPEVVPALYVKIPAPAASGYPVWYQPAGAHDSWKLGDKVEHPADSGQIWECTATDGAGNNSWQPGIYGWTPI